ncbi:MAG: nitroreductase, partial [Clostridiales bacterium]|nr:nitroreductase [Clostridiales bacterium]
AALASSNMELMAEALGLGVLYVGYFTAGANQSREIIKLLDLKNEDKVVTCLALGYPSVKYLRTVPRKTPVIRWR